MQEGGPLCLGSEYGVHLSCEIFIYNFGLVFQTNRHTYPDVASARHAYRARQYGHARAHRCNPPSSLLLTDG
jgi:hypothetical protein